MPPRKEQLSSTPTDDTLPVFSLRFADTQNTKTYHMMKQIAQIISSTNVIILVDNKNDQQQQMESRLKKYKIDGNLPEDTLILSDSLTHKSLSTEFKKMFRENRKEQIMILKFNFTQMEKLTDAIILGKEENHDSTISFQIFVDEGDIATKHENTDDIVDGQPKAHASFINLRKKCKQKDINCSVQFISATPQNIFGNYPIEKIYTHESHPDYIGYKDIEFVPLVQSKSMDMVSQVVPQIIHDMTVHGEKGNILICTNRKKVDQEKLLRVVIRLNVLTINYNGDGVRVFIPVQHCTAFENEKETYRSQDGKKVSFSRIDSQTFISKDIFIGDLYQMINNMQIQISVTIGKDLMGRGISFCSVSREDPSPLATTRMILDVSNTTHCVSIIQMIGRLLGTVCPNLKRILYCKQNVYDDYMKATEDIHINIEIYQTLLENGEIQYTNEIENYSITARSRDEDRANANVKTEIRGKTRKTNSEASVSPISDMNLIEFQRFLRILKSNENSVILPPIKHMYEFYNSNHPNESYFTLEQLSTFFDNNMTKTKSNLFRISRGGAVGFICERNQNKYKLRNDIYEYIREKNLL